MKEQIKITANVNALKRISKKSFVDSHRDAYPDFTDEDLGKFYDKSVGKPEKKDSIIE